jgi:hypothetical protein
MTFYLRGCLLLGAAVLLFRAQADGQTWPIPTFRAWAAHHHYLADEPDFTTPWHSGESPAQLRQAYAAQSTHPQWVSFVSCRDALRYRGAFDGLMGDDYPFYVGRSATDSRQEWRQTVRDCQLVARRLQVPLILIMQGFGGMEDGPFLWRCPSAAEVTWLLAAANGIPVLRYTDPAYPC